jgi:hypothetical protein
LQILQAEPGLHIPAEATSDIHGTFDPAHGSISAISGMCSGRIGHHGPYTQSRNYEPDLHPVEQHRNQEEQTTSFEQSPQHLRLLPVELQSSFYKSA